MTTAKPKKAPIQIEAEGAQPVEIKWKDLTFTIDGNPNLEIEVTELFENGKIINAVKQILGPEQWAQFKARRPRNSDLDLISDEMAKVYGFESAGE